MKKKSGKTTEKSKKILASVIIVALAAATTFLAGISSDREEQMKNDELLNQKIAVEYVVDMPEDTLVINTEETQKKQQKNKSKLWSLLSAPLWMAAHLAGLLLKPILGKLLTFILAAAALFGIMCLCLKMMYPDKSLKELLTKRNILVWLCCTGVFYLALNIPEIMDINSDRHGVFVLAEGIVIALAMVLFCKKPDDGKEVQPEAAA